jgi:hypothetical protein
LLLQVYHLNGPHNLFLFNVYDPPRAD